MKIMRLITENDIQNGYNAIHEVITEETAAGKMEPCKFKATLIQCEKQNRNGRVYPKNLMVPVVEKYIQDRLQPGAWRSFGELGHPEGIEINLDRVSHYITEMEWQGNDVIGVCKLLDTHFGKIADTILKSGCKLGVSTRGMGELGYQEGYEQNQGQVVTDYDLICVDIVADPSAPEGWVNGILESKEYIFENGEIKEEKIASAYKTFEKSLEKLPKKEVEEYLFERMKSFLEGI